jgi:uncharacterized protein
VSDSDPGETFTMTGKSVFRGSVLAVWAIAELFSSMAWGQARASPEENVRSVYDRLLPQIEQIRVIDNHGHPGFPDDADVDAMQIPSDSSLPFRLRENNLQLVDAARAMFQYPYGDLSPEHLRWLLDKKAEEKKRLGREYFSSVLDRNGIERAVANRVVLGSYLNPSRFLWVFFVDSFLFPFDAQRLEARNPDQKLNVPLQQKILVRELTQAHLSAIPSDLDSYLRFIHDTVAMNQQNHGVGMKFEVAYFRSLHFGDPSKQRASSIYAKYRAGGFPSDEEYRDFQDFVFRYLLEEAARLGLPVQIHTAVGGGDYFSLNDGNVMNLENILRDPRYETVTFVLLHGGFPHEREAIWLAARKNVYLDSSLMGIFLYPDELKHVLKEWLETFPDKVVFGSDTFPLGDAIGAEENYWLALQSAKVALAGALAEMVAMRQITEDEALKMARAYLHDTAARIYGSGMKSAN